MTLPRPRKLPGLGRILKVWAHSSCRERRRLEGRPSRLQTGTLTPCFRPKSAFSSPDVLLFLLFLLFFRPQFMTGSVGLEFFSSCETEQ